MRILLKNLLTSLRRYPTPAALNVAGLSVAFTAFLVILMQVLHEYGYDRWIPEAQCVFRVEKGYDGKYNTLLSNPLINDLKGVSAHISHAALVRGGADWLVDLSIQRPNGSKDVFRVPLLIAEQGMIDILGLELIETDGQPFVAATQALLPRSLAERMFPGRSAVGRRISADGRELTVSGVYRDIPENSVFYNALIRPWTDYDASEANNYRFFIRLDDPSAAADVAEAMNRRVRAFYALPDDAPEGTITVRLTNVRDIYFERDITYEMFASKGDRTTTGVLLAIAVLVIGIATINFINFASALTPVRMKMINLQKILGAEVAALRASLLIEAAAIALAAYAAAWALVVCLAGTPLADYVSADLSLRGNLPLAACGALFALTLGAAAGLYPACYMTAFPPVLAVKGSFAYSPAGRRYRMTLVGVQYVISLALIVAALFVNLQNRYLRRIDRGFDPKRVAVVNLSDDAWKRREELVGRLRARPEIEDVAFAYDLFGAAETGYMGWTKSYRDRREGVAYKTILVSDNFLRVLGIPVSAGRDFRPSDALRAPCTYIFNDEARRRYDLQLDDYLDEGTTDPTGVHAVGWGQIAGFMPRTVRIFSEKTDDAPFSFAVLGTLTWDISLNYCYIRLREGADPTAAAQQIRRALAEVSPFDHDVVYLDAVLASSYANDRKAATLTTLFSLLAVAVSLTGVFGLLLFETQRRRKEIGIRKVHGATSASVLLLFIGRFTAIVLAAFLVAAPLAWYGVSEWLRGFRSAVPLSGWVFLAALAAVLAVTLLTVIVRTRRTAAENPVESIKTE